MRTPLALFSVALLSFLLLSLPIQAQAPSFSLAQLMQKLASVKIASGHFVERKTSHLLRVPIMDSGTLRYVAPATLEKATLQPQPERLLVESDKLTVEHDGQTQVLTLADYPQIGGFIEGIRATLAGDQATLERIYTVTLSGNDAAWQLLLVPRDPKMADIVRGIRINGSDAHVQNIDTDEGQGDRTDMTIVEDAP